MKHFSLVVMAVLALGLSACKEKTETETTEKSVVNGAVVETKTSTETTVEDDGDVTREVDSETTVDPEGAMNKETVKEIHTEEKHD